MRFKMRAWYIFQAFKCVKRRTIYMLDNLYVASAISGVDKRVRDALKRYYFKNAKL